MEENKARRVVDALRERGTNAEMARVGVYQFGITIKLPDGREATWDSDGTAELEAQVMRDGVLVGFVPVIDGSDDYTEEQIIDVIVRTDYDKPIATRPRRHRLPRRHCPRRAGSSAGSWTASATADGPPEPSRVRNVPDLRPLRDADVADVLALNAANVEMLSPLDEPELQQLAGRADRFDVLDVDGSFAGFVVPMTPGGDYDSPYYRWFSETSTASTTSIGSCCTPTSGGVAWAVSCTTRWSGSPRRTAGCA